MACGFQGEGEGRAAGILGFYYYGTDGEAAIKYVEEMRGRYPELPVIVSEIACISRKREEVFESCISISSVTYILMLRSNLSQTREKSSAFPVYLASSLFLDLLISASFEVCFCPQLVDLSFQGPK